MLEGLIGQQRTFHTVILLEGDPGGGNLQPRMLAFSSAADRAFFGSFITVKGIGPRKALRAMTVPAGEIAAAVEAKDVKALIKLPQVGKRLAETIIAELAGKLGQFASEIRATPTEASPSGRRSSVEEDAINTLMALGERRGEAEKLLEAVTRDSELPTRVDDLVRVMLQARTRRG
jgi:Holliday junction DNA helicase RuvA